MKKLLSILVLSLLLSGNAYAKEDVLRCSLKMQDEPAIRMEIEIDLDKKKMWVDGEKFKINMIGERAIKAESDPGGNVKISIDRFDGFITWESLIAKFIGNCKKYKKIF